MSSRARLPLFSILLVTVLGCAGGAATKPRWVEAPDADLPGQTSFAWATGTGEPPTTILDTQIREAIRSRLVDNGYVETVDSPDFLVDHETLEQDAVEQGNPVRIGIGVGSWGRNVGGSVGTSVDVGEKDRLVQQLRVTVRALDPTDRRELWVGTTTPMPERPDAAAVNRAVTELMKAFPAKQ